MSEFLTKSEINQFNKDGAIFIKGKFDVKWIDKLKKGIERDIKNPSPRFKSHTLKKDVPAYLEDYWTWDLVPEFTDFVFNSPYAKIAAELMSAKKINLVMDNWFLEYMNLKEGEYQYKTFLGEDIDIEEFSSNLLPNKNETVFASIAAGTPFFNVWLLNLGLGFLISLSIPFFNFSIHFTSNFPLIKMAPSLLN